MALFQKAEDGFIATNGYQTYYKRIGAKKNLTTIVCLNGGPGGWHEYLLSLSALASERPVILYDQFGTGQSDGWDDPAKWKVETFVEQLAALRQELKLDDIHLYGSSWGGMLALAYMETEPKGVHSLVLASTMHDVPLYMQEADTLLERLSPGALAIARKHEKAGTTHTREYREIVTQWNQNYVWHGSRPTGLDGKQGFNEQMYRKMWGTSELGVTGTLKNWSAKEWIGLVTQPTLVIAGEFDEVTEDLVDSTVQVMPNAEKAIIEGGAHLVHVENPKSYLRALRSFLQQHDA